MKKVAISFSLIAVSGFIILGCNKKDNMAPVADKEFQSSVDASYAAMVISDIEMIASFAGEGDFLPKFYEKSPNTTNTITVTNNSAPGVQTIIIEFNNTPCIDGVTRDGVIYMHYEMPPGTNTRYYHEYGFVGTMSLAGYKVDGWQVDMTNTFKVTNLVTPSSYDPKKTNLSWSMKGAFKLTHVSDNSKNMMADVDMVKTLLNTSNPSVFPASKLAGITWSLATVAYTGSMRGVTSGTVPYTYSINSSKPLIRDFLCYPDKVFGTVVGSTSVTPQIQENHPFNDGVVSFTTSALYPRTIFYGNTDGSTPQCDNTGVVEIKGIYYPINFTKVYN